MESSAFPNYNAVVLAKIKKNALFLGSVIGNYRLFLPGFRLFKQRFPKLTTAKTDICIDGYPRSGNTYIVSAFLGWNRGQGLIASHHSHLAGNIKYALKRKIPTVVLIRKPEDAVSSVLVWDGLLNTTVALVGYIHFYNTLWKHQQNFLILCFDDVIKRPDICVERINQRFNSEFCSRPFSAEEDSKIRIRLKKADLLYHREGANASLPNPHKSQLKKKYSKRIQNNPLFPYAKRLFDKYSSLAKK